MKVVRMKRKVDSEMLCLPVSSQWIGKDIEIILLMESENDSPKGKSAMSEKSDWRDRMSVQLRILVSPEELIRPMDDIWEGYI
jgi:hypothetical protein